jgi:hypothetical protein
MPSASKILGDLVSSAGAISVTSGVANTAITGTITTAQIANSAITSDKVAADAITTAKVAADAIVTADIADANVTNAKIVSVANTKVTGLITGSQLANTAVTAGVYGGSSNSAAITIDAQGRITAASNVAASGGQYQSQLFTANGTFTCPAGVTRAKITVFGGGGGGSSSGCGWQGGFGGAGWNYFTVTPGTGYTVTIGAGGAGAGGLATGGGTTSFGALISATGGTGSNPGVTNGTNGSCANSLVLTGTLPQIGTNDPNAGINLFNFYGTVGRQSTSTALVWSASSSYLPGTYGWQGGGGVSGIALVEYIG